MVEISYTSWAARRHFADVVAPQDASRPAR